MTPPIIITSGPGYFGRGAGKRGVVSQINVFIRGGQVHTHRKRHSGERRKDGGIKYRSTRNSANVKTISKAGSLFFPRGFFSSSVFKTHHITPVFYLGRACVCVCGGHMKTAQDGNFCLIQFGYEEHTIQILAYLMGNSPHILPPIDV